MIRFRQPNGQFVANSEIVLEQFLTSDALTAKLNWIEFEAAPGVVWTWDYIEQLLFTPTNESNYIRGTQGNDVIDGLGGGDTIHGQGGDDTLYGGEGTDSLFGGAGNDTLYIEDGETGSGDEGNDTLVSTNGGNLSGGAGSDTYLIERTGDTTTINNVDSGATSIDVLRFGAGVALSDVKIRRISNDLVMTVRNPAAPDRMIVNEVIIQGFFTSSNLNRIIDEVRFTDDPATVLNFAALQALTLVSDDTSETLTGFTGNDILLGNGGNDSLSGLDGHDDLNGGTGADALTGGAGNDIYRIARGDGYDNITDSAGTDRIELAAGITTAHVTLYRTSGTSSDALVVVIDQGNQQVRINNHYASGDGSRLEEIRFADGTIWGAAQIAANVINVAGTANSQTGTAANNTFTVDHPSDTISEAANGGTDTVNASVSFTLPNNVENLNLTGPLNINGTGNALANVIVGNAGDNTLAGGAGADTLTGGAGDDTYFVDQLTTGWNQPSFQDVVTENAAGGVDTIIADTYSAVLPDHVERLILRDALHPQSGSGTGQRRFIGNGLDNFIDVSGPIAIGWARTVYVDGGVGADTMIGYAGDNVYVVDNPGDVVIELRNGDVRDAVWSHIDYTIGTYIENLTLLGSNAIVGTGNELNNIIDGRVNTAANELRGLTGNDTYVVDATDVVVEAAGAGIDRIEANTSYALPDNVENLILTGWGTGTGNAFDNIIACTEFFASNTLFGGDGNDQLDGGSGDDILWGGTGDDILKGGNGTDTMHGGLGNDTYITDESSGVIEQAGEGTDTVLASMSHSLGSNVENLTLTDAAAINGTGNGLSNVITGNVAANILAGGTGNDTLSGANGADVYRLAAGDGADIVDNASTDAAIDTLEFTDLARNAVTFSQVGDDLMISRDGSSDSVRVAAWFAAADNRVDFVQFTDQTLSADEIDALFGGSLMSGFAATSDITGSSATVIDSLTRLAVDLEMLFPPTSAHTGAADVPLTSNLDMNEPMRRDHAISVVDPFVVPVDLWTQTLQAVTRHLAHYEAELSVGAPLYDGAPQPMPMQDVHRWAMPERLRFDGMRTDAAADRLTVEQLLM